MHRAAHSQFRPGGDTLARWQACPLAAGPLVGRRTTNQGVCASTAKANAAAAGSYRAGGGDLPHAKVVVKDWKPASQSIELTFRPSCSGNAGAAALLLLLRVARRGGPLTQARNSLSKRTNEKIKAATKRGAISGGGGERSRRQGGEKCKICGWKEESDKMDYGRGVFRPKKRREKKRRRKLRGQRDGECYEEVGDRGEHAIFLCRRGSIWSQATATATAALCSSSSITAAAFQEHAEARFPRSPSACAAPVLLLCIKMMKPYRSTRRVDRRSIESNAGVSNASDKLTFQGLRLLVAKAAASAFVAWPPPRPRPRPRPSHPLRQTRSSVVEEAEMAVRKMTAVTVTVTLMVGVMMVTTRNTMKTREDKVTKAAVGGAFPTRPFPRVPAIDSIEEGVLRLRLPHCSCANLEGPPMRAPAGDTGLLR
ncbi:Protein of unknown function [Gryllus bimaculatus]|nr:Protein of unknown function [Gryllus bimaculatus]